jgi:hypothetical protein
MNLNCTLINYLPFSNIKFLKNFCFNDGVKVYRNEISTNDAYDMVVLEKNLFSHPKSHFCLVQQVSPENIQKYFIFGIKFDDFYIAPIHQSNKTSVKKAQNTVNIFTYEKTYLFISFEPLCKLFQNILQAVLNIKKLNFLHNMSEFSCIFIKQNYKQFIEENSEKLGVQINEILNFYYKKSFPLFEERILFKTDLNNITCDYTYPNPFNEIFLASDWLSKKFLHLCSQVSFYNILIRILAEHSIIFISDNIQHLTSLVLGFNYMMLPFKWPFIIIPNLPIDMMGMIESPVPFLIGILGGEELKKKLLLTHSPHFDIIYLNSSTNKVETNFLQKLHFQEPYLKNLKSILETLFGELSLDPSFSDKVCEKIYKKVFETLRSELACKIEIKAKEELMRTIQHSNTSEDGEDQTNEHLHKHSHSLYNVRPSHYQLMKSNFVESLNENDKSFGKTFCQTQLFLNYDEDFKSKHRK